MKAGLGSIYLNEHSTRIYRTNTAAIALRFDRYCLLIARKPVLCLQHNWLVFRGAGVETTVDGPPSLGPGFIHHRLIMSSTRRAHENPQGKIRFIENNLALNLQILEVIN